MSLELEISEGKEPSKLPAGAGRAAPHGSALIDRIDSVLFALRHELLKACKKHAPMHSPHEGHSVIREELDELWDHVKRDTGRSHEAKEEALQIAAMGIRYVLDLCDDNAPIVDLVDWIGDDSEKGDAVWRIFVSSKLTMREAIQRAINQQHDKAQTRA